MSGDASIAQSVDQQRCCHYWVIEAGTGPTSKGVCRSCGEEKWFSNILPAQRFDEYISQARKAVGPGVYRRSQVRDDDVLDIVYRYSTRQWRW